jgi:hypothetical protein
MNQSIMVVAKKYILEVRKATDKGETYQVDGQKKLVQDNVVCQRSWIMSRNATDNNELYVIDEEATAELQLDIEARRAKNLEDRQMKNVGIPELVKALNPTKEVKAKREGEPDEDWDTSELKQYCEDNNISFHHKNGRVKLLELINENK